MAKKSLKKSGSNSSHKNNYNDSNIGNDSIIDSEPKAYKNKDIDSLYSVMNSTNAIRDIKIDDLIDSPKNVNNEYFNPLTEEQYLKIVESIAKGGLDDNILVLERGLEVYEKDSNYNVENLKFSENEKDKYMILSGHHRAKAHIDLRDAFEDKRKGDDSIPSNKENPYNTIMAKVIDFDENLSFDDIQLKILDGNILGRKLTKTEIAKANIKRSEIELRKDENKTVSEIMDIISEKNKVSRRQALRVYSSKDLIQEFFNILDNGINLNFSEKLAMFDKEVQEHIFENYNDFKLGYTEEKKPYKFSVLNNNCALLKKNLIVKKSSKSKDEILKILEESNSNDDLYTATKKELVKETILNVDDVLSKLHKSNEIIITNENNNTKAVLKYEEVKKTKSAINTLKKMAGDMDILDFIKLFEEIKK